MSYIQVPVILAAANAIYTRTGVVALNKTKTQPPMCPLFGGFTVLRFFGLQMSVMTLCCDDRLECTMFGLLTSIVTNLPTSVCLQPPSHQQFLMVDSPPV